MKNTLEREFNSQKNDNKKLSDYTESSAQQVWWQCSVDNRHEWQARIFSRTKQGAGCPYCKGKKVLPEDSLGTHFPQLVSEIEDKSIDAFQMHCKSGQKLWWNCSKGHRWETAVRHRTKNGTGCPFCVNQKVCDDNSLAQSADPEILSQWHPTKNGTLTPDDVVSGSRRKVWWKCPKAEDHEWECSVYNRSVLGTQCPCCDGTKLVFSNCLEFTHPKIAAEWHPTKNSFAPRDVSFASNKKAWFVCSNDQSHEWECRIDSRSRGNQCPFCASSKGEKEIKELLESENYNFAQEYKISECKNQRPLPFDFAVFKDDGNLCCLIEYQGRHHYQEVDYFGGKKELEYRKQNDKIKSDYCQDNHIPLLCIPYTCLDDVKAIVQRFVKLHLIARESKTDYYLRWYEKQGDKYLGEAVLPAVAEYELRSVFDLDEIEPIGDCIVVEKKQAEWLGNLIKGLDISINRFDYFLEACRS